MIRPEPLPSRRALRAERERLDTEQLAAVRVEAKPVEAGPVDAGPLVAGPVVAEPTDAVAVAEPTEAAQATRVATPLPAAPLSAAPKSSAPSSSAPSAAAPALPPPARRERARDVRAARAAQKKRVRAMIVAGGAAALVAVVAISVALASRGVSSGADASAQEPAVVIPAATALPVPAQNAAAVVAVGCDDPGVVGALAQGSDADVIAAFGGATAFRERVASGAAPCVNLADPAREWLVANKQRPLTPLDWEPDPVVAPADMQRTVDGRLRPAAASALTALVAAAQAEGVGAIGLNSAFRSFDSQMRTYNGYVSSLGRDSADLQSARPGFSEHQTGLATDVAACDGGCGAIESFGGTAQGAWTAANAWRFGYIVRYEDGHTAVTGYQAEPWHLRYIGPELAQAYHDGGFHTLEEFFGLPAAPDYVD